MVDGKNRLLGLDEAHNFIDDEVLEQILSSREKGLTCLLADQTSWQYRTDILEKLLKANAHLLCYLVDKETASLISKYHPTIDPNTLTTLEKYHFIAKIKTKTTSPIVVKLKGIPLALKVEN